MNLLSYWGSRTFWLRAVFVYLVLLAVMGLLRSQTLPDMPVLTVKILGMAFVVLIAWFYSAKSIGITLTLIFIFQLLASLALRYFFVDYYYDPLGAFPIDAYTYYERASHINIGLDVFYNNMVVDEVQLDDMGFNFIEFIVFKIAGSPETGLQLMLLLNAVCVVISSFLVYKTSMLFTSKRISMFSTFVWGVEFFAVYTAVAGLKENAMAIFTIGSIYFIVLCYRKLNLKNFILAVAFASGMLFFRLPVFYMLVATLLFVVTYKNPWSKRYFYIYLIILIVIATYVSYDLVSTISEQRGYTYEFLEKATEKKMKSSGWLGEVMKYLSAFIGPFPNFVASDIIKRTYITLYSFSSMVKVMYSFFFVYSIYYVFRYRKFELTPLVIFFLLDTYMLIFTTFTLHDRYQWAHMHCTLILAGYGCEKWKNHRHRLNLQNYYYPMALLMILLYNMR